MSTVYSQLSINRNKNVYPVTLAHAGSFSPADSTIYYFGGSYSNLPTNASTGYYKLAVPKSGVITGATINTSNIGTLGTTEASTMVIRVNNTTDYALSTTVAYDTISSVYTISGLNIPVMAGDYLQIKWTTPAWVTNPTNVANTVILLIESPMV